MFKYVLFLFGFGITIIGLMYIILYLNLFTLGYNFSFYVNFIIRRLECYNFIIGIVYIILYLNLLTIGYNFSFYVNFIIKRIECWYSIIGIIIMLISIFKGGKNELYI